MTLIQEKLKLLASHISKKYTENEKDLTVKPTNLDFDKQKVRLTVNVFNEKVLSQLENNGHAETACFMQLVSRTIHILNTRSPDAGRRLRDPNRPKFESSDDTRFSFLQQIVGMFKGMNNDQSTIPGRVMNLTGQTSNALDVSITGVQALIKLLLRKGMAYCLTVEFQSDRIEGEFGTWCQMNGGNYYMSMENIESCMKLQRLKLFAKL